MTDHDTRVAAILAAVEAYYEHQKRDANVRKMVDRVVNSFNDPASVYSTKHFSVEHAMRYYMELGGAIVRIGELAPGGWVEIKPQTFQWFHLPTTRQQLEREAKSRPPLEPPKPHHITLNDHHRRRRK
jgi:hypothetical protein